MAQSIPQGVDWVVIFDTRIKNEYFDEIIYHNLNNKISIEINKIKADLFFWEGVEGDFGHGLINQYISLFPDNYYHMLDDDTIAHPNLINDNIIYITGYETYDIIIGDQNDNTGGFEWENRENRTIRKGCPENMKVRHVDMGQMIIHGKFFLKYGGLVRGDYKADGLLIEELYEKDPNSFHFLNKTISYYNILK